MGQTTPVMGVPFLDLAPSHAPLKAKLLLEIGELIDAGDFANGAQVAEFEQAFARYCGTSASVGVANGLDGLRLSLLAAGVGRGDEVVVPAMTFVASFEAVAQVGATPVPIDISSADYGLALDALQSAIGSRTRAVMPVHLYGQLVDMGGLSSIADAHDVVVIEDACQAHGATREGIAPGSKSRAAIFSFYPGKNLGAMGDAGAVITNDDELADRLRALREHGQVAKYLHEYEGYTSRLDTLQALVLLQKLPLLDRWNAERRHVAGRYLDDLAGLDGLVLPPVAPDSEPAWHLFVVRTRDPQAFAGHLAERGVRTGRHYPEPPHLSGAWRHLGHPKGSFPVAEELARECVSLPIFPGMSDDQVDTVVVAVRDYFNDG
jgi:dTDP-4-amino-4,6-dideoxygalactose transaminase